MSIRTRLALSHALVAAVVLIALAFAAYITHANSLYDDVDRELRNEAATALLLAPLLNQGGDASSVGRSVEVALALYDEHGGLTFRSSSLDPPLAAEAVLSIQDGPAYPPLVGWFAGGIDAGSGAFATQSPDGTGRIRLFATPATPRSIGSLLVWTELGRTDRAIRRFEYLLAALAGSGTLLIGLASYAAAGRVLRPILAITRTADGIAASGNLARRVPLQGSARDELRALGLTFNRMLGVLERAQTQQERFLAAAAHELRTPLTLVRGNLQLLGQIRGLRPDQRQALEEATAHAERLSRVTADLLALARADSGTGLARANVALAEVVLEAVAAAEGPRDRRRIKIDALEPVTLDGDRGWLRLLFVNLLTNALRYSPPDSSVRLTATAQDGRATVTVTDTGVGMFPAECARAFERFFRADAARDLDAGGSGLGLAVAKWVAESHGGEIRLASRPGEGTTVTVELPALRDVSAPPDAEPPPHDRDRVGGTAPASGLTAMGLARGRNEHA